MRHCFFFCITLLLTFPVLSQTAAPPSTVVSKPVIDSAAIANWADLLWSEPSITPDGKYFMYPIDNLPAGSKTLVLQSTENEWKKEFVGPEKGFFSGNSKLAVFKNGDSLYIQALGKDKVLCIGNVASYKNPKEGAGQWLAYVTKTKELTLHNLVTDKKQQYQNVWEYQFDNGGRVLLMKQKSKRDTSTSESVEWVNLSSSKQYRVWQSANDKEQASSRFSFDEQGKQLVFMVEDKTKSDPANTIWYYREAAAAIEKVNNATPGIDSGMIVSSGSPTFSKNGKYIFFKITPKPEPLPKLNPAAVQVDVWSYKDLIVVDNTASQLTAKYSLFENNDELPSFMSVTGNKTFCIGKAGFSNSFFSGPGDFAIVSHSIFVGDKVWQRQPIIYYIVFLQDGTKTILHTGKCDNFSFSNDGTYLVYFDSKQESYFSYNFLLNKKYNISKKITGRLTKESADFFTKDHGIAVGIEGWLSNDAVLIYDNYDIWKVDPSGKKPPLNLTNGYGMAQNIKFRILRGVNSGKKGKYLDNKTLLLTAYNSKTKSNGFFIIQLNKLTDPKCLVLEPYLFYAHNAQTLSDLKDIKPLKADGVNYWIVQRQTVSDAPNFFGTNDFKTFKPLTNIQPQKNYNWLTTELVNWKQFNGEDCQGILYKPTNFDSSKKYPLIVHYYMKRSDLRYQFLRPAYMVGGINVPWFVSRGYLVFTPDIHYTIGEPGESVVNSVVSGTRYLFQFPFVDSTKVAINGHSFGGYETNYLVTHTNIFAAASEGSGSTDFISHYGSLTGSSTLSDKVESAYGLGTTPWDSLDLYIKNSPIFSAYKVTTPLLIMHNKKDHLVPWSQGVELFIALRRLNKKVWMLQYDNGGHGVVKTKDEIDYTIRTTQFFDHYLKGTPAPKWMIKGIPARDKGIDLGYELDFDGKP